jgi:hypothetical protein
MLHDTLHMAQDTGTQDAGSGTRDTGGGRLICLHWEAKCALLVAKGSADRVQHQFREELDGWVARSSREVGEGESQVRCGSRELAGRSESRGDAGDAGDVGDVWDGREGSGGSGGMLEAGAGISEAGSMHRGIAASPRCAVQATQARWPDSGREPPPQA